MAPESLIIGIGTALLGGAGLWHRDWFLAETSKGRFLVAAVGPVRARWVIAACFVLLMGMGISLALGWLTPLRW